MLETVLGFFQFADQLIIFPIILNGLSHRITIKIHQGGSLENNFDQFLNSHNLGELNPFCF